jgi:hypothetical protein
MNARGSYSPSADSLLMCTVTALQVRCRFLERQNQEEGAVQVLKEIEEKLEALTSSPRADLSEAQAWTEVNRLRMMTVLVEPQDNLLQEIQIRLDEAGAEGASATPRLRTAYDAAKLQALDHKTNPPTLDRGAQVLQPAAAEIRDAPDRLGRGRLVRAVPPAIHPNP